MKEFSAKVSDPVGLHARPATVAVKAAGSYKSDVNLVYKDQAINMKSIMGVMSLGVPADAEIKITVDGEDEESAIADIENVLREQKIIA